MELYWPQIAWKVWCSPEFWGVFTPEVTESVSLTDKFAEKKAA